jgi:hypothetical protein
MIAARAQTASLSTLREPSTTTPQPFPYAAEKALIPYSQDYIAQRDTFVERAELESGLSSSKWRSAIEDWCDRLWQFGTPPSFLASMSTIGCQLPSENPVSHDSGIGLSFTFPDRKEKFDNLLGAYRAWQRGTDNELHRFSPEYADISPGTEQERAFISRFEQCGGCQSIAREVQLRGNLPHQIEVLEKQADALYLVNAYPWDPLTMLFVNNEHDDLSNRITICPDTKTARMVEGKTLGALTSAVWLESFFSIVDQNQSVGIINHPLSGMSAPYHFHGQSFPIDIPKGMIHRSERDDPKLQLTHSEPIGVMRSPYHPFDTLMIKAHSVEDLARVVSEIRNSFERDGIVHTLSYHQKCCFIGVMRPNDTYTFSDLGARMVLNCFREVELSRWDELVARLLPQYGTFEWEKYL